MKRPFVAVVSFYAAGLLLAEFFQPPLAALFAVSFPALLLACVVKRFRPILLCALLTLAGWTNLLFHTAVISPNDLRRLIGNGTEIATVRGALTQTPQIKISQRDGDETAHSVAQVRVSEIQSDENWQPAAGEIVVSTPGLPAANLFAGQSVEISGVIGRPPPPAAGGVFDERVYLQTRGII